MEPWQIMAGAVTILTTAVLTIIGTAKKVISDRTAKKQVYKNKDCIKENSIDIKNMKADSKEFKKEVSDKLNTITQTIQNNHQETTGRIIKIHEDMPKRPGNSNG